MMALNGVTGTGDGGTRGGGSPSPQVMSCAVSVLLWRDILQLACFLG